MGPLAEVLEAVARLRPGFQYELVDEPRDADVVMTFEDERPVLDTTRLDSVLGPREWRPIDEGIRRILDTAVPPPIR